MQVGHNASGSAHSNIAINKHRTLEIEFTP